MYKSASMKRLYMEITVMDGNCHIFLLKSQWKMYLAFVLLSCCVAMFGSWLQMFWSNTLVKQSKKTILLGLLSFEEWTNRPMLSQNVGNQL